MNRWQMDYQKRMYKYILERLPNYKEICELFLKLNVSSEIKKKLESILYIGLADDYYIGHNNGINYLEYDALARLSWAFLLIKNPSTFQFLLDNKIVLFHGTNSSALPNILKYGLLSYKRANKLRIKINTGEENFINKGYKRNFSSFTDVLDIAQTYSLINITDRDKVSAFPIVIGIKHPDDAEFCVFSDVREFVIRKDISPEQIDVLLIPRDKIEIVKKMVGSLNIKILAMDDIQKKFYKMQTDFECFGFSLEYDMERYNSIKESSDYSAKFDINDIKSFVLSYDGKDYHQKGTEKDEYKHL